MLHPIENILQTIVVALDCDALEMEQALGELDCWDSLGILSVQAALDSEYAVTLSPSDFEEAVTVGDLIEKVQLRLK